MNLYNYTVIATVYGALIGYQVISKFSFITVSIGNDSENTKEF